ncbi:hypothetical protein [Methylorubrum aminovorans]|uniref:hypothetical protein n=1 Tax=Methylorubrum aminovorans TaxID=269069 RepID=UPI003C30A993
MSMLTLVVPGSGNDFADLGVGYLGELDLPFQAVGAYLLGGRNGTQLKDQSGSGRDLTVVGAPTITGNYATCTQANCFAMPLSGDQLSALSASGFTFAAVARSASTASSMAVSNFAGTARSSSLGLLTDGEASMINQPNGTTSKLATAAARGSRFSLYVGTQTPTAEKVFARRSGSSLESAATSHASGAIGGVNAIRIGGHYVTTSILDPIDIAFAAAFPFTFAAADADALYASLNAYFTGIGMPF